MSARPVILALAFCALALLIAAIIYHRPYLRGAKIIPAADRSEVTEYAQEFTDALSITQLIIGKTPRTPYVYLAGGEPALPDGRFTLRQRELRNDYHEIRLIREPSGAAETVLVLQERDPGSGTSHDWQWSRDSKAIFIYGSGTPAGHAHSNSLALIYLVEQRTLYSIDHGPYLSKRQNANSDAPNTAVQRTRSVVTSPASASAFPPTLQASRPLRTSLTFHL